MDLAPAINLIKEFEGYVNKAYKCPAGVWTIGYGTTIYPNGNRVKKGDTCTPKQAVAWLLYDINTIRLPEIQKRIKVACTGNEICALISFVYNIGISAFARSTLLRKLNSNANDEMVANEFMKWTKANGKVLKGLVRRREAERKLFLTREPSVLKT